MKKTFILTAQDRIGGHADLSREFFSVILGMDFDECLVTDESLLSDFASCGLPDEIADATDSLQALYAAWDEWVVARIARCYTLHVLPTDPLVAIFERLEACRNSSNADGAQDGLGELARQNETYGKSRRNYGGRRTTPRRCK